MTDFFTADTHLGHKNVIKYCDRPYTCVDNMDAELIDNWNSVVSPSDTVYHVGDFFFNNANRAQEILNQLNGTINLIRGNHDRNKKILDMIELRGGFVKDMHTYKCADEDAIGGKQEIVLCHYAMRVWNKAHYGAWHLYGHSHGSLPDDVTSMSFDVGVDVHNYTPITYEQVKVYMFKKQYNAIDHHTEQTRR